MALIALGYTAEKDMISEKKGIDQVILCEL
jgi:hypothetical protein